MGSETKKTGSGNHCFFVDNYLPSGSLTLEYIIGVNDTYLLVIKHD